MTTPPPDLAATLRTLPAVDHRARIDRLRSLFPGAGVDALVVTHLTNVRYLSGFTGSAGLLVVTPDAVVFVTDGRYDAQATRQVGGAGIDARIEISSTEQRRIVADAVAGDVTVGLEAEHVSWSAQRRYAEDWFPDRELVPTSGLVEELRLVKDDAELARMGAAAAVADAALASVRHRLLDGPTEADFGLELDTAMRHLGASRPSFETIVASGPNGALPHARPTDRRISEGDMVVLDFGAVVDGYCSDMTRTLMVGEPTEVQARMIAVVTEAQAAGVAAVAAGVPAAEVDTACRAVIAEAGWEESFTHGTGHGVGLDIHEAPRVAGSSDATLAAGQVVTVEPGVYLPEHGGVRVEDSLVVTTDGSRPLTLTPKLIAP